MFGGNAHHFLSLFLRQTVVIAVLEAGEDRTDFLRRPDVLTKRHSLAHGRGIGGFQKPLVNKHPFGERVDAADELAGVIRIYFLAPIGHSLLQSCGNLTFTQSQDQHLVVRQQVLIHGLAKTDAENFRPIHGLVIHGTKIGIGFFGLFLALLRVQARRSRHVQTFFRLNEGVVMYLNEGGILFILQRDAGCSMRLVADDQVKVPLEFFLGIGNNSN